MLTFLRGGGASLRSSLTSPGLFVLLIASAVLIDFGSCFTEEPFVVPGDVTTAHFPEVRTTEPTKPARKPILVTVKNDVFKMVFTASFSDPRMHTYAMTVIDGWDTGRRYHIAVEKYPDTAGYYWTLKQKAPGDQDFASVFEHPFFFSHFNELTIYFPVTNKTESKVQCWTPPEEEAPKTALMKKKEKCSIASMELVDPPADDNVAPMHVGWDDPTRFLLGSYPSSKAARGFLGMEITVAATVITQMLLAALRD